MTTPKVDRFINISHDPFFTNSGCSNNQFNQSFSHKSEHLHYFNLFFIRRTSMLMLASFVETMNYSVIFKVDNAKPFICFFSKKV